MTRRPLLSWHPTITAEQSATWYAERGRSAGEADSVDELVCPWCDYPVEELVVVADAEVCDDCHRLLTSSEVAA